MVKRVIPFVLVAALPACSAVRGQGVVDLVVGEDSVSAAIELAGGIAAELEIVFEDVVGLSADSLGLAAALVDPLDPDLVARLPDPLRITIPAAFPVLIEIEPPADGPLTFSGAASIDLHTHNLAYSGSSLLRLFSADEGGTFQDMTRSQGIGSYRTGGTKGGFSEFLVVTDARANQSVIQAKFDALDALLDSLASLIDPAVLADLDSRLSAAETAFLAGLTLDAIAEMEAFEDIVAANSGGAIPDVWRAAGDLVNAAGELRSAAATLVFSLTVKANKGL